MPTSFEYENLIINWIKWMCTLYSGFWLNGTSILRDNYRVDSTVKKNKLFKSVI